MEITSGTFTRLSRTAPSTSPSPVIWLSVIQIFSRVRLPVTQTRGSENPSAARMLTPSGSSQVSSPSTVTVPQIRIFPSSPARRAAFRKVFTARLALVPELLSLPLSPFR